MSGFMEGPWRVGYRAMDVLAPSQRGGFAKVCDIRGWGYLTGKGDGALGLPEGEAIAIQAANAALIAAAPDMLAALQRVQAARDVHDDPDDEAWAAVVAAVVKATTPPRVDR